MLWKDVTEGGDNVEATEKDLEFINKLSSKKLGKDDVYVFRLVACDNQVDRDMERFSDEALESMAKLYIGKTILKDHMPKTC